MSFTLYNPLDKFASYSIHHITLACRSTDDAMPFADEAQNQTTLASINEVAELGDAIPGSKDTAYLVMDTRRFSQFSVQSLKFETFVNGIEKDGSHGTMTAIVNMVVQDSVGISFLNFLQFLMNDRMKCNFDGMIFMHRVIFVGHTKDGNTETVQNVTMPLMMYTMEMNLDYAKGTYTIEFMPVTVFDTQKHERWMTISTASRYFTGKGASANKLGEMVLSLEAQLNKASAKYFAEVQAAFLESGKTTSEKKFGRLVQYMITLPKGWSEMLFTGASTANSTETIFKKIQVVEKKQLDEAAAKTKKPGEVTKMGVPLDTHLSVEAGMTIPAVLDIIFSQVKEIAELGVGNSEFVTFYKHHVAITSSDTTVTVHVDVIPFIVPNLAIEKNKGPQNDDKFFKFLSDGTRVPKNYAEFDYIFTGKNKDILNFDLKMQNLTFMLLSNVSIGPGAMGLEEKSNEAKPKTEELAVDKSAELVTARAYDAILLPRNSSAELDNFKRYTRLVNSKDNKDNIKITQNYVRNLSLYYAMSPIRIKMTIRGNPDIMAKFNQGNFVSTESKTSATTASATGAVSKANLDVKTSYREHLENQILKDNTHYDPNGIKVQEFTNEGGTFKVAATLGNDSYAVAPVFITVNIKGPKVDFITGGTKMQDEYSEKLLEGNYYVVMGVSTMIEGHIFTQELDLFGHNLFGIGKLATVPTAKPA